MSLATPNSASLVLAIHLALVVASLSLFAFRLAMDQRGIQWRKNWPWLRWLPHANDTLLLFSGIALCLIVGWRPWAHPWLGAKLTLLVLYVMAGRQALSASLPARARRRFGGLALMLVTAMVCLAALKPL